MSVLVASGFGGKGILRKPGPFVTELNTSPPGPGVCEAARDTGGACRVAAGPSCCSVSVRGGSGLATVWMSYKTVLPPLCPPKLARVVLGVL